MLRERNVFSWRFKSLILCCRQQAYRGLLDKFQYCDSYIGIFLYCSPFSYRSSNFAIAKLSLLISLLQIIYEFWRLVHVFFLYCFPYSYRSSNYCDSNSCCSFTLLKALAKSKSTHIAITFKSENKQ